MSNAAIATPAAKLVPLKWLVHNERTRMTRCGRYTVARYGAAPPYRYLAWVLPGGTWFCQIGPATDDYESAKALCEAHHLKGAP